MSDREADYMAKIEALEIELESYRQVTRYYR